MGISAFLLGWPWEAQSSPRRATWVVPHAERPRFPGPLLRRTRGPDPSSKSTLWAPSMGFSRQEYWSGVPLPSPHLHVIPQGGVSPLRNPTRRSMRPVHILPSSPLHNPAPSRHCSHGRHWGRFTTNISSSVQFCRSVVCDSLRPHESHISKISGIFKDPRIKTSEFLALESSV